LPQVASSMSAQRASPPPSQAQSTDPTSNDGSGGFQDYMSAVVATNAATPAAGPASAPASSRYQSQTGAVSGQRQANASTSAPATTGGQTVSAADVAAALKAAGLSPSEVAAALAKWQKGEAGNAKTGKTKTDGLSTDTKTATDAQATAAANGIAVPVVVQPVPAALPFGMDPVSIAGAAEQAIAALTGQATAGQTSTGQANAVEAAATQAAATTSAEAASAASDAASAALAKQGVISVTGQAASTSQTVAAAAAATVAAGAHTIASQIANPNQTNPAQLAGEVATATIRQVTTNMPLSRMSEIRAKLQAAQLGAAKTSGLATSETSETNPNGLETTATSGEVTTSGALAQLVQKFASAVETSTTGNANAAERAAGAPDVSGDQTANGGSDPTATLDPSLAGLTQTQAPQTAQQQAVALAQAVPLTAVASTIVSQAKAGNSEFTIRLDPAGLGQIDVKMKVSSDGEVRAHMIVDQPATLDLMMRDRQQLQQSLDQAGFKTDPSSLQFSLRDQGQQGQGQQQAQQDQSARATTTAVDPASVTQQSTVYSRPSYVRADGVDLSV